jgi:hypothetical protein
MEKWAKIKHIRAKADSILPATDNGYKLLIGKAIKVVYTRQHPLVLWDFMSVDPVGPFGRVGFIESDLEDAPFSKTELFKALNGE